MFFRLFGLNSLVDNNYNTRKVKSLLRYFLLLLSCASLNAQNIYDNPPQGVTLRAAAEWEEIQALVVTWRSYPAILAEIIRYAQEECKVIVHASNPSQVQSDLINVYGVPVGPNVVFLNQASNSIWIRDYGANPVYINDVDSLILVDWKYNRPQRVQDDTLPRAYARYLNLDLYQTTSAPNRLVHTGGNYMSDGFGNGFSSELVLDENTDKTETEINNIMNSFMGIEPYIKMQTLPYDGIHHIDMHMKLLDEETLLIGEYPQGIADGPQIEANMLYVLDNYNSVFGTPYKIVRIVQPPDDNDRYPNQNGDYRTYSNAVFVNKTVLLPIYEEQYDTTALRIWRENLPGYRVVGIDCNSIISASGAIHCITHSVGVNDPLLISHQALHDTYDTENNYQVSAVIRHRSGISNAKLYWTTDTTQAYELADMTVTDEANHIFTGFIPAQPAGSEVFYFIGATAESGKSQVRPIVAPDGSWSFMVLDSGMVTGFSRQATENLFALKAFPNPASGLVCVPLQSEIPLSVKLEVLDITGRLVEEVFDGRIQSGEKRFYLHTQNWQPGIYLIRATTRSGSVVQRITVQ